MGLFDSDFNIDSYVRTRIPQLDNLENRDLFKRIVGKLTVDMYNHVKDEYDALERRVFDEAPKADQVPDLITCVVSADKYDLTDDKMFPIFAEDLEETKIITRDMIDSVKNGNPFFLYTCMFRRRLPGAQALREQLTAFQGHYRTRVRYDFRRVHSQAERPLS